MNCAVKAIERLYIVQNMVVHRCI